MSQGTTAKLAEKLRRVVAMSQGSTSKLAEKLRRVVAMSQGSTSVVPKESPINSGALAPEGRFLRIGWCECKGLLSILDCVEAFNEIFTPRARPLAAHIAQQPLLRARHLELRLHRRAPLLRPHQPEPHAQYPIRREKPKSR